MHYYINVPIGLVRNFLHFFRKFPRSRRSHTKGIYRRYEYLSNNNKIMDIHVDLELEMKISRRKLRLLLFHEFYLGRKVMEATSNKCDTMGTDGLAARTAQH